MNDFNLIDFLNKNRIFYRDSGKNVAQDEVNICCFECGEDGFHLGINEKKQMFHCWICGFSGNLVFLIARILNISYKEAIRYIYKPRILTDLEKNVNEYLNEEKNEILENNEKCKLPAYTKRILQNQIDVFGQIALNYLQQRGIIIDIIEKADLYYCYHGKFQNRVVIPIYYMGELVNYIGRTWVKDAEKRYLNCSNNESKISTKNLLYNYDNIKYNCDQLIITEGVFDCFKTGLDRSVATLGIELTLTQKHLILSLNPKKLIFLFDEAAFEKAKQYVDWFNFFCETIAIKPNKKDPGCMSINEIDELLKGA